jgi:rhodanese-related sulfurtransferase
MAAAISTEALQQALAQPYPPLVIDVRREAAFLESGEMIAGAIYRDPAQLAQWALQLPAGAHVVVHCVHGHQVSQGAAQALVEHGFECHYLEGGIGHWTEEGRAHVSKPAGAHTRWVTRERPKIDRIACPWLVSRFIDPGAEFLYVPVAEVAAVAAERGATPYDVAGAALGHAGDRCSFDAFIAAYRLQGDPALSALADIVRAADTGKPEASPQAPGLLALSLGLSKLCPDDHAMLAQGMVMYDALYAWCSEGKDAKAV